MGEARRLLYLVLIMVVVVVLVSGVTAVVLYRTAIDGQRARLVETAQSWARLIEAIARHDAVYEQATPGGPVAATLSQIVDAHEHYTGFGETGEFTLARLDGGDIVFLLSHRHLDLEFPAPVPFDSELAEPMRQALSGRSGSIIGLDYRGAVVLAAHEPVAVLDLGIVAKIDMAEVRRPFLNAALLAAAVGLIVVSGAALISVRVSNRIIRRLRMQEKLLASEKLAALGQLAGGVGHELRNPLGAIKNAAYFLSMALDTPDVEVRETLGILDREVATAEGVISSLLDYARARPPSRRKVDVNQVVGEALASMALPDDVTATTRLDAALPVIMADPGQLGQVFRNIITNAVQAMPEGGEVAVETRSAGPGWIAVAVRDTGTGIAAADQARLFEPLFTGKARGIGLGLSICKTLVDGHGGAITVESEVGKGSAFTVKLPTGTRDEVSRQKRRWE